MNEPKASNDSLYHVIIIQTFDTDITRSCMFSNVLRAKPSQVTQETIAIVFCFGPVWTVAYVTTPVLGTPRNSKTTTNCSLAFGISCDGNHTDWRVHHARCVLSKSVAYRVAYEFQDADLGKCAPRTGVTVPMRFRVSSLQDA